MDVIVTFYKSQDADICKLCDLKYFSFNTELKKALAAYAKGRRVTIVPESITEGKVSHKRIYYKRLKLNEIEDADIINMLSAVRPGLRNKFIKYVFRKYLAQDVFEKHYFGDSMDKAVGSVISTSNNTYRKAENVKTDNGLDKKLHRPNDKERNSQADVRPDSKQDKRKHDIDRKQRVERNENNVKHNKKPNISPPLNERNHKETNSQSTSKFDEMFDNNTKDGEWDISNTNSESNNSGRLPGSGKNSSGSHSSLWDNAMGNFSVKGK